MVQWYTLVLWWVIDCQYVCPKSPSDAGGTSGSGYTLSVAVKRGAVMTMLVLVPTLFAGGGEPLGHGPDTMFPGHQKLQILV